MAILRACGVSGTPRPVVSITAVSGILDRLPSRANDNEVGVRVPWFALARGYANGFPQKGKRAQRTSARRAPVTRVHYEQAHAGYPRYQRFLCNGFNGLSRVLAAGEFVLPPWPGN